MTHRRPRGQEGGLIPALRRLAAVGVVLLILLRALLPAPASAQAWSGPGAFDPKVGQFPQAHFCIDTTPGATYGAPINCGGSGGGGTGGSTTVTNTFFGARLQDANGAALGAPGNPVYVGYATRQTFDLGNLNGAELDSTGAAGNGFLQRLTQALDANNSLMATMRDEYGRALPWAQLFTAPILAPDGRNPELPGGVTLSAVGGGSGPAATTGNSNEIFTVRATANTALTLAYQANPSIDNATWVPLTCTLPDGTGAATQDVITGAGTTTRVCPTYGAVPVRALVTAYSGADTAALNWRGGKSPAPIPAPVAATPDGPAPELAGAGGTLAAAGAATAAISTLNAQSLTVVTQGVTGTLITVNYQWNPSNDGVTWVQLNCLNQDAQGPGPADTVTGAASAIRICPAFGGAPIRVVAASYTGTAPAQVTATRSRAPVPYDRTPLLDLGASQSLSTATVGSSAIFNLGTGFASVGVSTSGLTASGATIGWDYSTDKAQTWQPMCTAAVPGQASVCSLSADQPVTLTVSGANRVRVRVLRAGTGSVNITTNASVAPSTFAETELTQVQSGIAFVGYVPLTNVGANTNLYVSVTNPATNPRTAYITLREFSTTASAPMTFTTYVNSSPVSGGTGANATTTTNFTNRLGGTTPSTVTIASRMDTAANYTMTGTPVALDFIPAGGSKATTFSTGILPGKTVGFLINGQNTGVTTAAQASALIATVEK